MTSSSDGSWHLATATFPPGTGMRLYVDGALTARTPTPPPRVSGWPSAPSSFWFKGSVAQAGVYYRALAADEIAGQYLAGH